MTARNTPVNSLLRSVREAAAGTDQDANASFPRTNSRPNPDPTSDKQAPMTLTHGNPSRSHHTMQLMPEALARVHMQERLQEAEHERLVRALRLRQRAERMTLRARKALASAVMQ